MDTASLTISTPTPVTPAALQDALRRPAGPVGHGTDVVAVTAGPDGLSRWELRFRGTPLRWTQRVTSSPDGAEFVATDGDLVALSGSWTTDGSVVRIAYTFRTSVAHLAGAVDPMVARVLLRAAAGIVGRLGGGEFRVLDGAAHLYDLPAAS